MIEENMNMSIQGDQNLVICPKKKREETKTWSFVQKEKPRLGYHKTYIQVFENKAKT
jgi:antitoxin component of MazEF toxin-antitoxin module